MGDDGLWGDLTAPSPLVLAAMRANPKYVVWGGEGVSLSPTNILPFPSPFQLQLWHASSIFCLTTRHSQSAAASSSNCCCCCESANLRNTHPLHPTLSLLMAKCCSWIVLSPQNIMLYVASK